MTDIAPGGADGSASPGRAGSPADPGQLGSPGLTTAQARAEAAIEQALAGLGLAPECPQPGSFLVKLPGQHKLATMTWLIVGTHSLLVEAFFCRQPDEEHARFYRFLLERNGQMYGVHFALDPQGDVYLVGRLPLASVTADEVDRLLGCVLSYSDENFNQALSIGFASSIRKEWAWRVKRGESLANLAAFARFASEPGAIEPPGP
jgi:putative sensory transduction regulator